MTVCPCCHQPIAPHTPIETLEHAPMSILRRTIVRQLVDRFPLALSPEALIAEMYRGSREPEYARVVLSIQMLKLRVILHRYGWTIPTNKSGRGNVAQYRLAPLPYKE